MNEGFLLDYHQRLEGLWQEEEGVQFVYARDLYRPLGYATWDKFQNPIGKAKEACVVQKIEVDEHFSHVGKVFITGNGAKQNKEDIKLTRYAAYLVAMNGDPRKQEIAYAQNYFATSTRKFELVLERIAQQERIDSRKKLTESENIFKGVIYQRGVEGKGFAFITSAGDAAFFGGHNTAAMKQKYNISNKKPLADHTNKAINLGKALANTITTMTVEREDMYGQEAIKKEHIKSNTQVRQSLVDSKIYPEQLSPEEDIKKVESRMKKEEKTLTVKSKSVKESNKKSNK